MKEKVLVGLQMFVGLMLVVFGSNGFLHFMPMPEMPQAMGAFMGALNDAGYVFPLAKGIEVLAGIAFLTNKYTSLMAVILMPVMINAFLAHLMLDVAGIGGSAMVLVLTAVTMYRHRADYTALFKA